MKKWNMLLSFLGLFCMLSGTLLCIKDSFRLYWWEVPYIITRSFFIAGFVVIIYQKRKTAVAGILVSTLCAAFVVVSSQTIFSNEFVNIDNQVVGLINSYYQTNHYYVDTIRPGADYYYFILILALFLGFWLGIFSVTKKWRVISLLPIPTSIVAGLLLGYPPSVLAVLLLLVGGGILYGNRVLLEEKIIQQGKFLALLCMGVAVTLSFMFLKPISARLLENSGEWKRYQLSLEDKALAFMDGQGWFPKYFSDRYENLEKVTLSNRKPRLTDEVMFRVTVQVKPLNILYMKKFTGGVYQNGTWEVAAPEMENEAKSEWFISELRGVENGMDIELIGENEGVILAPYGFDVSTMAQMADNAAYETQIVEPYTQLPDGQLERLWIAAQDIMAAGNFPEYEEDAAVSYIYTMESDETIGSYEIIEVKQNLYTQQINSVKDFIQKDTYYSFNLNPVPKGQDFTEYFLFEQKKGFCVHYATAGTLLFRAMGIPSRYASGYIIMPSDFQENEDGSFTAVVKKKRAHAWTEVIQSLTMNSLGIQSQWAPVELTPPAYVDALRRDDSEVSMDETVGNVEQRMRKENEAAAEANKAEQEETIPAEMENNIEADKEQNKISNTTDSRRKNARSKRTAEILSILSFLALILFVSLLLRRIWILGKRKKCFLKGEPRQSVLIITKETLRVLKALGYKKAEGMSEPDYGIFIQNRVGCFWEDELIQFIAIARLATYGKEEISDEQRQYMYQVYIKLAEFAGKQGKTGKRLYWKYISLILC